LSSSTSVALEAGAALDAFVAEAEEGGGLAGDIGAVEGNAELREGFDCDCLGGSDEVGIVDKERDGVTGAEGARVFQNN